LGIAPEYRKRSLGAKTEAARLVSRPRRRAKLPRDRKKIGGKRKAAGATGRNFF
jgi:hypothetical protein